MALAHAALNLPFAILLLKSFFDEVPPEISEAAKLDGANRFVGFQVSCIAHGQRRRCCNGCALLYFFMDRVFAVPVPHAKSATG
ncbi:MAG: hypothetical protein HC850_17040, partial [Rhodomicrobium sp.]|nr:hypothetical protein [Rhodomicrobium sp.]